MKMQPKRIQETENSVAKFKATKGRIDVEQAKINIKMLYCLRTNKTEKSGLRWYQNASQKCKGFAELSGVSFEQFCALVAVLSPMTAWEEKINGVLVQTNINLALQAIEQYNLSGEVTVHMFGNNNRKAKAILDGDLEVFNPATAPKTWNFYNNLLNPSDADFVTIDSHAFAILFGMFNVTGSWLGNYAAYKRAAQCYNEVADELGILPCDLQAVCWTTRKRFTDSDKRITSNEYADANSL